MDLTACANTQIGGGLLRGASGGEIKRLCIACELILDPAYLFLDEPTSGLDSETATKLMLLIQKVAWSRGIGVLSTIHQPGGEVFSLFDDLFVMVKGKFVYHGPPEKAVGHFVDRGFTFDAETSSPAEFVSSVALRATKHGDAKPVLALLADGANDLIKQKTTVLFPRNTARLASKTDDDTAITFANSCFRNTWTLTRRMYMARYRERNFILARFIKDWFAAICTAFVYRRPHITEHGGMRARIALLNGHINVLSVGSLFYVPTRK